MKFKKIIFTALFAACIAGTATPMEKPRRMNQSSKSGDYTLQISLLAEAIFSLIEKWNHPDIAGAGRLIVSPRNFSQIEPDEIPEQNYALHINNKMLLPAAFILLDQFLKNKSLSKEEIKKEFEKYLTYDSRFYAGENILSAISEDTGDFLGLKNNITYPFIPYLIEIFESYVGSRYGKGYECIARLVNEIGLRQITTKSNVNNIISALIINFIVCVAYHYALDVGESTQGFKGRLNYLKTFFYEFLRFYQRKNLDYRLVYQ